MSEPFKIRNSFKQVSVLAPTLFGIFFLLFPKQAFDTVKKSTYLNTRNNGKLFNPSRLKAKKKGKNTMIRELMSTCLGSTISYKLSINKEIYRRIGRAAATLARFRTIASKNPELLSRSSYQCITFVFLVHVYTETNPGQQVAKSIN